MDSIGRFSGEDSSSPKKSLNRRNYYIDSDSQKILDRTIEKHKSIIDPKHAENFTNHILNKIKDDVIKKQKLFIEAKRDFDYKKAISGFIELRKKVEDAIKHARIKRYNKRNKRKNMEKEERSYYRDLHKFNEERTRNKFLLQEARRTYLEKEAKYIGSLIEQSRVIERLKSEIKKNNEEISRLESLKADLSNDISRLERNLEDGEYKAKQLEQKKLQLEKGYTDVIKICEDKQNIINNLNCHIAGKIEKRNDLEGQLEQIQTKQKESQQQITHLADGTSRKELHDLIAVKEEELASLQRDVESHNRDIQIKNEQKESLLTKKADFNKDTKETNSLEKITYQLMEDKHRYTQLEGEIYKFNSYIAYKKCRKDTLKYKQGDLLALKNSYLRIENDSERKDIDDVIQDEKDHPTELNSQKYQEKITEIEKNIADNERSLAEQQEKKKIAKNALAELENSKQNLATKEVNLDEITNIETKKEDPAQLKKDIDQLDLQIKIAYVDKEIMYIDKEIIEIQQELKTKNDFLEGLEQEIQQCDEAIQGNEKILSSKDIKEVYATFKNLSLELSKQYNKIASNKLDDDIEMLKGLEANVQAKKTSLISSENNIHNQKMQIKEYHLPDHNEDTSLREIESFIGYHGLKATLKSYSEQIQQSGNISQVKKIVNNKQLESHKILLHNITKDANKNQDLIDQLNSDMNARLENISELQSSIREEEAKKSRFEKLIGLFSERKDESKKPSEIDKLNQFIIKNQNEIQAIDQRLPNHYHQEQESWKSLEEMASEMVQLLYKDVEHKSKWWLKNEKLVEYLDNTHEAAKGAYILARTTFRKNKKTMQNCIRQSFTNAESQIDNDLKRLQASVTQKNGIIKEISQELEGLRIDIPAKELEEAGKLEKLYQQRDNLNLQSSLLHTKIATISQTIESHQQEIQNARIELAAAETKKREYDQANKDLEALNQELEAAKKQLQQKQKEIRSISDHLTKAIEEKNQKEIVLSEAEQEFRTLQRRQNGELERLKKDEKDLNDATNRQPNFIREHYKRKISALKEELATADNEFKQSQQQLKGAQAELQIAWKKVNAFGSQQDALIKIEHLPTEPELQDLHNKKRNAQVELVNAMIDASEAIMNFIPYDKERADFAIAKLATVVDKWDYRTNYEKNMQKYRDFYSEYEVFIKADEKKLGEEKKCLLEINNKILQIRSAIETNWSRIYSKGVRLTNLEKEIRGKQQKYNQLENEYNSYKINYKAWRKINETDKSELLEVVLKEKKAEKKAMEENGREIVSSQKSGADQLVNPGQERHDESSSANLPQNIEMIREIEQKLKIAHVNLQKILKEKNDIPNIITKLKEEIVQLRLSLENAEKEKISIEEEVNKKEKLINNRHKFLEYRRQQLEG